VSPELLSYYAVGIKARSSRFTTASHIPFGWIVIWLSCSAIVYCKITKHIKFVPTVTSIRISLHASNAFMIQRILETCRKSDPTFSTDAVVVTLRQCAEISFTMNV
jgi:hypothetical protein